MYSTHPYETAPSAEGRKKLEATFDFLYRQRLLILLCTAIVLGAAAAFAYTRTPVYESASLVKVNLEDRSRGRGDEDLAVGDENLFATNDRSILAEVFLLQTSALIRERVAERIEELSTDEAGVAGLASDDVTFDVADQAASTILVTAASEDPEHAALLADLYADEYVRLTEEAARGRLTAQRTLLEEWEAEQRQELERLEDEQRARAAAGSRSDPGQEASVLAMQISSLEAQRDQLQTELQTRRASLRTARADLADIEPRLTQRVASGDEQRLEELQAQVAALRSERTRTERRYPDASERDPRVTERLRQIDTDVQRLEAEAEEISQGIVEAGGLSGGTGGASNLAYAAQLRRQVQEHEAYIQALEAQAERVDARIAEHYAEMRLLPQQAMAQASQQIAQAQLERERRFAEETYQDAASRLRDLRAVEEGTLGYAQVIQRAEVPFAPSQIPASRLLLLGAFLGLSLGLGLSLVRDKIDNRIYKPDQLREWGYPLLATIPNLGPLIDEEFDGDDTIEAGGRQLATRLVTLLSPLSPTAEAYRHLRTNVLAYHGATYPVKVVLVTSPGPEDGKSTTASNLAIALAQGGHRTLLLDADLRRPSVHKLFGIRRSPGLIQGLLSRHSNGEKGEPRTQGAGGAPPESARVGIDNLAIVPAGEPAAAGDGAGPDVAMMTALGSAAMTEYLQRLREAYDVIVIDTPPVLATTDALQLARQCDAVVVTVRARQTREGELTHVIEALEQVGAPVVGTVLNGFDVTMAYGYKYRYRNYTAYGPYPAYGLEETRGRARSREAERGKDHGEHPQPASETGP